MNHDLLEYVSSHITLEVMYAEMNSWCPDEPCAEGSCALSLWKSTKAAKVMAVSEANMACATIHHDLLEYVSSHITLEKIMYMEMNSWCPVEPHTELCFESLEKHQGSKGDGSVQFHLQKSIGDEKWPIGF
jgi:hypothetical protein